MVTHTIQILFVDDDTIDVMAFKRAMKKHKLLNPIHTASNGLEALKILRGDGTQPPLERPYIVLLDLNMPRMNGLEFLDELRQDPALHGSVVFVLTTSEDDRDKTAAYSHHIAGYIVKSHLGHDFVNLLSMLQPYWRIVELERQS
jgi:CheY-like chemotaxis protein